MIPPKRIIQSQKSKTKNGSNYSLKDTISIILKKCKEPLSVNQITRKGQQMGLVNYSRKKNISKCVKKCLRKSKNKDFVETRSGYYTLYDLYHMDVVCTMFLHLSTHV